MELDVEQLQKDLKELEQKKEQAAERLRTLAPRGRGDRFGRGRGYANQGPHYGGRFGSGPGRGAPGPGLRGNGRRAGMDGYQNGYNDTDWEGRSGRPRGGFPGRGVYGRGASFNSRDTERDQAAAPVSRKRTLSSAVVVDGEQRIPGTQDEGAELPSLKRPAPSELDENPAMRKRNRRMFGSLLGTLQRFKEEEKAFQQTPTAQKQAEALKRAEEKAAAEGQRLRQMERQKKVAERQGELDKIRQINLQADLKALEIIFAKKILNRQRCLAYLITKTSPGLHWVPKVHGSETRAALQQRQKKFEEWKIEQQELLESEKEKLKEQAAARKAAALARAKQMQENGNTGNQQTAEDDAVAKEEAELEQQLAETRHTEEAEPAGNGQGKAATEPADMQADIAAGAEAQDADKEALPGSGSPDGEEDGELPDVADDDQFRVDEVEVAGGDLLDKLDMETGNPDAENIEDLLE